MEPPRDACRRPVVPPENGSTIRLPWLCSPRRRFQTEATVLVQWYRWPLLSIGEADTILWVGVTGPGWVSPARVTARGRCDGGPQPASPGASKLSPGGAVSSKLVSLRWSPSVAGGAAITGALLDVIPTQWRVEWTAMAGCGWRYPSLGAMPGRRPGAHVQVDYILVPQNWEPMRPRYLARVLGQWGSSLGRSVKVMGASYDFKETKTGSGAQCGCEKNLEITSPTFQESNPLPRERERIFKDLRPLTGSAHSSLTDRPGANLTPLDPHTWLGCGGVCEFPGTRRSVSVV